MKKLKLRKIKWNRLFYNKKFAIFFSVLVSIALWAVLVSNNTEKYPHAITGVPIKITLSNAAQADGMRVFKQSDNTATVYVTGNNLVVSQLKSSDLVLTVPLAANITTPGTYTFPLVVENSSQNTNSSYHVDSITTSQVLFYVDRYREKTFDVQSKAQDYITYKDGYKADPSYFVGIPSLSSGTVTISGPEKQVLQVNRVGFKHEITDTLTDTQKFTTPVLLYDANGNQIEKGDLSLNPEKIDVTISVLPRQTVSLEPTFTNKPTGLTLDSSQVQITPSQIDVAGPKDTLTNMNGKISLDPIDFASISPTHNTFDVNVSLPTACKNLSNSPTARVTLNLGNVTTKQMTATSFSIKDLGSDKTATVNSNSLSVTVVGPASELAKLTDSNIVGSVDLTGKENFTGQTEAPVTFTISNSSSCWVYGSYMVNVNVTSKSS